MKRRWTPETIFERLHGPLAYLGILFLVVVVSERLIEPTPPISTMLLVTGWVIWAIFAADFGLRMWLSDEKKSFLRKNWWQLVLLILPFLSFFRLLAMWRVTRLGRVVSAGVRGSRSARSKLSGRIGWVTGITVIVIILAADLLYEFGDLPSYAWALHDAALATIAAEPIRHRSTFSTVLEVPLAIYSVVVFAALAGSVGAFFLERREEEGGEHISEK